jgi:hypothetical protein
VGRIDGEPQKRLSQVEPERKLSGIVAEARQFAPGHVSESSIAEE